MTKPRAEKDKRYEDRHKEERKAKCMVWGTSIDHKEERKAKCMVWGTSIDRKEAEEMNAFLEEYGYTKVQLIRAGYKALLDKAAEHDLGLAKIMDGYDDFFESELEKFKKNQDK